MTDHPPNQRAQGSLSATDSQRERGALPARDRLSPHARAWEPPSAGSPEDDLWLSELVRRSPLLADARLRRDWQHLIPWLPTAARYELAAILLDIERACLCD